MKFERKTTYADEVEELLGNRFGDYVESFTSDSGQVSAELFRKADQLIAYVTFAEGIRGETVTDAYIGALRQRATELGYESKLRVVYAGI